jgi:hypothetical protein
LLLGLANPTVKKRGLYKSTRLRCLYYVSLWSNEHGETIFQRVDWLSFWLTTGSALALYVLTLPPEVTLAWSGVLATSANYGGISIPPGYPLWNLYGWLFIKLVPFSNVGWRLALSSSVAGAFASGLLALMVSRGAATILESSHDYAAIPAKEKTQLRVVCAVVSGLGFAAHHTFWGEAVTVDNSALGCCLFALTICLLMCWSYFPERNRYLLTAAFVYGLTLSVSLLYWVLVPAVPIIVMARRPGAGRDLFFVLGVTLGTVVVANHIDRLPDAVKLPLQLPNLKPVYIGVGALCWLLSVALVIYTRRLLTHWGLTACVGAFLILGLMPYVLLPIISMTTPPVNCGYPRTAEGFIHVLSRGQFEHWAPTSSSSAYLRQISQYAGMTAENLGWLYSIAAIIPFYFFRRIRALGLGWLLGLLSTFLCLSLLVLAVLNPPPDRQASELDAEYFLPSHLVLTLWAGYGLVILGSATRRQNSPVQTELPLPAHG